MFFFGFHGELRQQNGRHTLFREKTHVQARQPVEERTAGAAATQLWGCDPHHRVFKAPNRSVGKCQDYLEKGKGFHWPIFMIL